MIISKKFGQKITCTTCGIKFYNLNKKSMPCPKCGSPQDVKIKQSPYAKIKDYSIQNDKVVSLVRLEKNNKPEVLFNTLRIITTGIKKIGWYYISERKILKVDNTLDLSKIIYLSNPPIEGIIKYLQTYRFKGIGSGNSKKYCSL